MKGATGIMVATTYMLASSYLAPCVRAAAVFRGRSGSMVTGFASRRSSSSINRRRSTTSAVLLRSSNNGRAGSICSFHGLRTTTTTTDVRPWSSLTLRSASDDTTTTTATTTTTTPTLIPLTFLSGFLGSGKTTALKNILENKAGVKVGVIVNDVADVNIDAKLLRDERTVDSDGTVELQNGCACCSLADELLTSVETLCEGRDFDAVVVELSGVADPVSVKSNWEEAKLSDHPATKLADVSKIITVIDSCTFGTDWMTWNTAGERDGWTEDGDDCAAERKVPELLAEQVEAADVLIVNKIDLAGAKQVAVASAIATGLNKDATVYEVSFGKVDPLEILGISKVSDNGDCPSTSACKDPTHKTCGDSTPAVEDDCPSTSACKDPTHKTCGDSTPAVEDDCPSPSTCNDPTHKTCGDAVVLEAKAEDDCASPSTCDDPTHDHSHAHNEHATEPKKKKKTSTKHLGIMNFVYKSSRPFNSPRLLELLNRWPVPIKDDLDLGEMSQEAASKGDPEAASAFLGVLRSKGFTWLAPASWKGPNDDAWRHDTAMYWSHAGKHFGITSAGKWWGSIGKERMRDYFTTSPQEYERIVAEDWASEEFGDRRQEIVFIGTNLDEELIKKELNSCLCTDQELDFYRQQLQNFIDTTSTVEAAGGP